MKLRILQFYYKNARIGTSENDFVIIIENRPTIEFAQKKFANYLIFWLIWLNFNSNFRNYNSYRHGIFSWRYNFLNGIEMLYGKN